MESTYLKKKLRKDKIKVWDFFIKGKIRYLTPESVGLGILLSIASGFLDAYTYVGRDGVFAWGQTGNILLVGVKIVQGKWAQGLLHVPPIIAFVIGALLIEVLTQPVHFKKIRNPARLILFIETVILLIVGFLPPGVPNILVTTMVAFVASIQFSFFRQLGKWSYSNAMLTGNLRTATDSAYLAIFKHDMVAAKQSIKFLIIIIFFIVGGVIGTMATIYVGTRSIWIASAILLLALVITGPKRKPILTGQ